MSKAAKLGDSNGGGIFALIGAQTGVNSAATAPIQAPGGAPEAAGEVIALIHLSQLRIDVSQPRRPLPLALAQRVNTGELLLPVAVQQWAEELKLPFDLPEGDAPETQGNAVSELAEIRCGLAPSILDGGLINPITVTRLSGTGSSNATWQVETGERRTLAYAFLCVIGHAGFDSIPARVVDGANTGRRQLDENDQRRELSAIHRARMAWGMRYRLSNLRLDWARAAAGHGTLNVLLATPARGDLVEWQMVAERLGMSAGRVSQLIQVFDLGPEALALAEACGFSEKVLREVIRALKDDPAGQLAFLKRAATAQAAGTPWTAEDVRRELARPDAAAPGAARSAPTVNTLGVSRRAVGALHSLLGDKPGARATQTLARTIAGDAALARQLLALKPLIDAVAAEAAAAVGTAKTDKRTNVLKTPGRKLRPKK